MTRYLVGRLLAALPVVVMVSFITFMGIRLLPGDPVQYMYTVALQEGGSAGEEQIAALRRELGLDQPIWVQYGVYLWRITQGDLGYSIYRRLPVSHLIMDAVPYTLQLATAGLVLAIIIGLLFGIIAASNHRSTIDTVTMLISFLAVSMPTFFLGLILILLFAINVRWFPAGGQEGFQSLVLPAVTLGLSSSAIFARLTRSSMLEVLRQDYVVTARAKGLVERMVVMRHALRNALIPVLTMLGLQFGVLLSGTVIVETVFARKGVGLLTITAIQNHDYPMAQGMILFVSLNYVVVNLLVDILYAVVDPRIRYS